MEGIKMSGGNGKTAQYAQLAILVTSPRGGFLHWRTEHEEGSTPVTFEPCPEGVLARFDVPQVILGEEIDAVILPGLTCDRIEDAEEAERRH